ncbi:hypothetical protein [Achromobacter aegrifaciens]
MTENNAAQAVQESERNAAVEEYFGHRTWIKPTASNFRLFEAGFDRAYALLSKLRAEGVQAVRIPVPFCVDTTHKNQAFVTLGFNDEALRKEFVQAVCHGGFRVPADALASAPVAGEAVTMKEICPDCGHQFQCFHNPYINQLRAAPQASEAVLPKTVQYSPDDSQERALWKDGWNDCVRHAEALKHQEKSDD